MNTPYRCNTCVHLPGCGASGMMRYGEGKVPVCHHDRKPGAPCHDKPERMVPSREA